MRKSIQIREEENLELMLAYAQKAGFREVAISLGSGDLIFRDDFEDGIAKISELLKQHNLVCRQTHMPCYHLLVSSEETEEKVENAIKNSLKASALLGAEWTAFHPRSAVNAGYNLKKSFEANKRDLESYLPYAEKYGVGIAVENMPLYPYQNPQWRFFGGGWEELIDLCDSFQSDKIGICWDFGHAHTAALDQCEALQAIGDRLKITHVHDNYRNGDHHQLPLLASTEWGSIDWAPIMKTVKNIGYKGPMTLELIFPPLPMLESFVKCCHDSLTYLEEFAEK